MLLYRHPGNIRGGVSASKLGIKGTIYLPENASRAKAEPILLYGANLKYYGDDCVQAEIFARETARKNDEVFISPYNDPEIIWRVDFRDSRIFEINR